MKKRSIVRLIDAVFVVGVLLGITGFIGARVLESKKEYDAYYEATYDPIFAAKPMKLFASLKKDVHYYKNNLADPKPEDFEVKARFLRENTTDQYFEAPLDYAKHGYKVKPKDENFYKNGGLVTVTYKSLSVDVNCRLINVAVESLQVVNNPYKIIYENNSTFDKTGLKIQASFNDGSKRILEDNEYTFNTTSITNGTEKIVASYSENNVTKSVDIPVTVSSSINDTTFVSLKLGSNIICPAEKNFTNIQGEVIGVYESGNSRLLDKSEYSVAGNTEIAVFGQSYEKEISLISDPSIKIVAPIKTLSKLVASDFTYAGGTLKSEAEYVQDKNGTISATGNSSTFIGNFANSVQTGKDAYIRVYVKSAANTVADITFDCSNSYCVETASGDYTMKPLKINTICDLSVANEKRESIPVTINNSIVLKGCGPDADYAPLFNIYSEFTVENVALNKGYNEIELSFKACTDATMLNCWGESPSTMNVRSITLETKGESVALPTNPIVSLEFPQESVVPLGKNVKFLNLTLVGKDASNNSYDIDPTLVIFEKTSGADVTKITTGENPIKATLASNPTITATKTFTL